MRMRTHRTLQKEKIRQGHSQNLLSCTVVSKLTNQQTTSLENTNNTTLTSPCISYIVSPNPSTIPPPFSANLNQKRCSKLVANRLSTKPRTSTIQCPAIQTPATAITNTDNKRTHTTDLLCEYALNEKHESERLSYESRKRLNQGKELKTAEHPDLTLLHVPPF